MQSIKKNIPGLAVCLAIAVPSWLLGKLVPVIGGPVFSILIGMLIALFWTPGASCKPGIGFTSKKVLQAAVVLLGFGLNLNVVLQTGKQSLPIIVCTITTSLLVAFALHKLLHIDGETGTLIGVGRTLGLPREEIDRLFAADAELADWGRRMAEEQLRRHEEYFADFAWRDKSEQYKRVLREYPQLLQRIALKDLAAYLFVTPQSLSRIRAEIK